MKSPKRTHQRFLQIDNDLAVRSVLQTFLPDKEAVDRMYDELARTVPWPISEYYTSITHYLEDEQDHRSELSNSVFEFHIYSDTFELLGTHLIRPYRMSGNVIKWQNKLSVRPPSKFHISHLPVWLKSTFTSSEGELSPALRIFTHLMQLTGTNGGVNNIVDLLYSDVTYTVNLNSKLNGSFEYIELSITNGLLYSIGVTILHNGKINIGSFMISQN